MRRGLRMAMAGAAALAFATIDGAAVAAGESAQAASPPRGKPWSAGETAAAALITPHAIAAHVRFLADDALEGRGVGTRGGELTVRYIASQMQGLGLAPGGDNGSYFQKVPLVGIKAKAPDAITVKAARGGGKVELRTPSELVVMSGVQKPEAKLADAELVFVGYGIVAPEFAWDDYKDVDVRGKVVLIMNNDPEGDPALFAGKTRLWYGRWDYKYEQAAKKGAAGAIIIHTLGSAGYPWQVVESSNTGEKFELPAGAEPRLAARMWIAEEAAGKVAALGGQDMTALRAAAEKREFRPVMLGARMSFALTNTLRRFESANVIGALPGADPRLGAEAVIWSAHHDHLGVGAPKNGDAIYNGAVDNASGVAALLAIARAAVAASPKPKRSLVFLAVTAEEQGLLGSKHYAEHPTFAPNQIAANLNMDSMNKHGRTHDVSFVGFGKSSLDAVVVAAAAAQGRVVHGDATPGKGGFYRSDQFSFARIGVPGIYMRGGPSYRDRPAGWGREQGELFEKRSYHQPSDEFDDTWNLAGIVEDAQLYLVCGLRIASDPKMPLWKPGDEFEAARQMTINQLGVGVGGAERGRN